MGSLYECLKDARLDKYYSTFRAQGITTSEALVHVSVHDCQLLGINSADDRRRLVELIKIVKAVHNTGSRNYPSSPSNRQSQNVSKSKLARKRNRSPVHVSQSAGRALSTSSDVRVMDQSRANSSSHHLSAAGAAMLDLLSDESEETTSDDSDEQYSDYEPAVKHSVTSSVSREVPLRVRKTPVEKVKHGSSYNYGVPGAGSNIGAKPKVRSSSAYRQNDEKIRVCVRKRPLSKRESKAGETDMVTTVSTTTLVVNEPKQAVDLTAFTLQHEFMFDEVFEDKCTNEDVYIRAARPLINCIFDGGSATCFAYGQTGAGKTHTMIGNREVPGLYLLASHDIFSIIKSGQYGHGIKVWVSFFEIYCGQLFDLLNKRNRLHAREDGSQRVCIAGLTETQAMDEQSLMQVLEYGNSVRSKGATGVNPDSSRSHAVLQMEIRDRHDKRLGRISFIDLAGSERAADSADTDKQTRMEGAEINQSLLALKECIRSIDQESRHKPFRQSKLTHILKDSFIGNSRTCMIANISPASQSCEHTLNTLRYADRVKELRRNVSTSASTSRSTNVAMANILMNIPASAPSLFQPSNILCSSTPMRQNTRSFTNRSAASDILLDPSETPIKGHAVRRKTSSSVSRSESKSQANRSSNSVSSGGSHRYNNTNTSAASRSPVVRHIAPTNVTQPNVSNVVNKHNTSSNSESDQTDTDSCNVTGPQKPASAAAIAQRVQKFDKGQKLNIGTKSNTSQNIPVVKSTDTDNDFPTTDFNDEVILNDLNRSGKTNVAASVPVFPLASAKNYSDSQLQDLQGKGRDGSDNSDSHTNKFSSVSASVPVLQKKMYTDNKGPSAGQSGAQQKQQMPSRDQKSDTYVATAPSSTQKPISESTTPVSSYFKQPDPSTVVLSRGMPSTENTSNNSNRLKLQIPPELVESFDDDALFDAPSLDHQRLWTPRTPIDNVGTQPRVPQDPSTQPEIPAVLPAKSTELTTFSQRSPRWHMNKVNPNNFPPPQQQQQGFRPNPVMNLSVDGADQRSAKQTAKNTYFENTQKAKNKTANEYNSQVQTDLARAGPALSKKRDNTSAQINNDLTAGSNKNSSIPSASSGLRTNNIEVNQEEDTSSVKEPTSANWFSTPADFDTHIARSVSKGRKLLNEESGRKGSDNSATNRNVAYKNFREEEIMKDNEGDDYLPIQRQADRNRSAHSDSGILSAASGTVTPTGGKDKTLHRSNSYKNSEFSQPSYFSDSTTTKQTVSSILKESGAASRHRIVHSPVNKKQPNDGALLVRDFQSLSPAPDSARSTHSSSPASNRGINSPVNGKQWNGAVKTEKLKAVSVFSPIHPEPVTTGRQGLKSSVAVSKDILHPTPVNKMNGSADSQGADKGFEPAQQEEPDDDLVDLKSQLISSHEDQLATVTSLCKQEMKLLLGAKAGNKSFEEYMKRVSEVLTQKMSAIQLLQDQIIAYQLSTQDSVD